MELITVKVNYNEQITINNEYSAKGPIEMTWFPNNDLIIETEYEKIVFNGDEDTVITPQVPEKSLSLVENANVKLVQNNVARYVVIDDKYAFKLPKTD